MRYWFTFLKVFLTGVLKWLQDVASISEDFKRLLAEEILKPFEGDEKTRIIRKTYLYLMFYLT